jgi:hypothetical protein
MNATSQPARAQSRRRWVVLAVLLNGAVLCVIAAAVAHAQAPAWHIVQGPDGTLYALYAGQRFTLEPDPITGDELAQLYDGGDAGSVLDATGILPTPATAPTGAAPTATSGSAGAPTPTATPALLAGTPSPVPATPGPPGPSPTPRLAPTGTVPGSRESPIPINSQAPIADNWQLKVLSTEPDGTKDVLATNGGRQPPSGAQYFLAKVQLTNTGDAGRAFDSAARLRTVGPSGVPYLALASACGNVPNALSTGAVDGGATITGNICWAVQSQDAGNLALYDAPLTGSDLLRTYFALH